VLFSPEAAGEANYVGRQIMFLMERHENIPLAAVGAFVQRYLDSEATIIVVTRNSDGRTCTVSVQRD
jgi:hypothetical protein